MTFDFQVEQRRRMLGTVKRIGNGLIDRGRDRSRLRVGGIAAVYG
jgi:hypothetical protein